MIEGCDSHNQNTTNGIDILEEALFEVESLYDNCEILMAGDFNSRTSELNDFVTEDKPNYIPDGYHILVYFLLIYLNIYPISCCLDIPVSGHVENGEEYCNEKQIRFKWNSNKAQLCKDLIVNPTSLAGLNDILELIDSNTNDAAKALVSHLQNICTEAGLLSCHNKSSERAINNQEWFDSECVSMKRKKCKLLNDFRATSNADILQEYVKTKQNFNKLCVTKQKQHKENKKTELCNIAKTGDSYDLALIADTPIDLQRRLNNLEKYCEKWNMTINMDKSNIVVFKNGGKLSKNEKWYFNNEPLKVVSYYKYLGIYFSNRLKWTYCCKTLRMQCEKALNMIKHCMCKLGTRDINLGFKLFDSMVAPILYYGAELWGTEKVKDIETVQNKFCDKLANDQYCIIVTFTFVMDIY
ncbi:unnamed protein product [Mytilus edulis]|uniref:Uncharacterized protein n=1 Tax=Mytilus edulis TaxID=6550 RepID=A0A8S3TLQ4_MYTED|nr:unnamed protein product [Mytilus edulis]